MMTTIRTCCCCGAEIPVPRTSCTSCEAYNLKALPAIRAQVMREMREWVVEFGNEVLATIRPPLTARQDEWLLALWDEVAGSTSPEADVPADSVPEMAGSVPASAAGPMNPVGAAANSSREQWVTACELEMRRVRDRNPHYADYRCFAEVAAKWAEKLAIVARDEAISQESGYGEPLPWAEALAAIKEVE